ncbi:5-oxoprolinase isoform X3 [Narcine bancroftii]|uniref:5-oxoprolinase isoform X3 n=1 Tax=Narcine bancroftii TaxID=1343680 RepID=UPI003831F7C9
MEPGKFQFAIDRGGTFTDVFARCPGGKVRVMKLLSEDPTNYRDAPTEGIRRILQEECGMPVRRDQPIDTSRIDWIRMGTTVATNALLERKGERIALLITKGFKDLLHIGNQSRPKIFDLEIVMPEVLYEEVIEVEERVVLRQAGCLLPPRDGLEVVTGFSGECLEVWTRVNLEQLENKLKDVLSRGIRSLAVVLLHSYTWSEHEQRVGELAMRLGFLHVSLSADVMPMIRVVPRGYTACADAYLTPCIRRYISGFRAGFQDALKARRRMSAGTLASLSTCSKPRRQGSPSKRPSLISTRWQRAEVLCCPSGQDYLSLVPSRLERTLVLPATGKAKGHDTSRHVLACFGGAGGQHACAIARALGMKTVFIHKYGGILSAYGLALADVVHEAQEPCSAVYGQDSFPQLDQRMSALQEQCVDALLAQGFHRSQISTEAFLHMRYARTDCALMCSANGHPARPGTPSCRHGDFRAAFTSRYMKEFGFVIPERPIMVDNVRVRGCGKSAIGLERRIQSSGVTAPIETEVKCYFDDGYVDTAVYLQEELSYGHTICGPAIIIDKNSTILIEPDCEAEITQYGDMLITVGSGKGQAVGLELDTVQLSIFSHRFMSIAEQMGRVLQRTAISTNIKERLDFSCALFGPEGGLVSNAPHIPVHLGAMQETVQFQISHLGSDLEENDVILSNHPIAGGSHLPDLTVITPVFRKGIPHPVFFLASRGHHADIGGITPGSMPPHSKSLQEEGAVFVSFKLVKNGVFQEEAVTQALLAPAQFPGNSGTRNLHDNLSDLRAQVAANRKGIQLMNELIDAYGLEVVQAYMAHIQANAEIAVREMLRGFVQRYRPRDGELEVSAEDHMDDGTPIRLKVSITAEQGSAVFDFTASGTEVFGNCNAPRAITLSALIYCLRCMVGQDIPLNQGCLAPVKIILPKGSILDPSPDAAVVGGNVLTSQRVVDVIFKAFGVCAASQGCMNNITFGNEQVGYYETVAGGSGAGPQWHGRGGVHTHMTNTRITDPEILEKRYPVILKRFELNPGSGGNGYHRGGDGVVRELLFRERMVLSVLTERRVFRPYGLDGGEAGARGLNLLLREDGRTINLGAKTSVAVRPGDTFQLYTPGGGGWGSPEDEAETHKDPSRRRPENHKSSAAVVERGSVFEYKQMQESV